MLFHVSATTGIACNACACVQEADGVSAESALMMFRDHVRRLLNKLSGYECQEAEGRFPRLTHKSH